MTCSATAAQWAPETSAVYPQSIQIQNCEFGYSETDGNGDTLKYSWDGDGNLATITYPDGHTVTYGYNSLDQMSSVEDWLGHTTSFSYDGAGNLTTEGLPNSTTTSYGYNTAEEMNKVATVESGTTQFSFDASGSAGSLDNDGNVKSFTTSQISGYGLTPGNSGTAGTDTYTYDNLSRMTADTQTGSGAASSSSGYAANSEMTSASGPTIDNGTDTYGTAGSDAGQLKSITGSSNTYFGYDNQGNRTCTGTVSPCSSSPTDTYTYDEENRLIKEQAGSATETYTYDGNSLLQSDERTIPGACPSIKIHAVPRRHRHNGHMVRPATLSYTYYNQLTWNTALGSPTLAVTDNTDSCNDFGHTDYVMGPNGEPIEQIYYDPATSSYIPDYYYQDFQGNTRELIGQSGTVDETYNEPPWGVAQQWYGSGGNIGTPLQYGGTYTDQFTGLVYDQARWYDPSTGQFLSQDPVVDQTLQPYAYANDQPDSGGRDKCHVPADGRNTLFWCSAGRHLEAWLDFQPHSTFGVTWAIVMAHSSGRRIGEIRLCNCGQESLTGLDYPVSFWTFDAVRGNHDSWPHYMWSATEFQGGTTNRLARDMLESSPRPRGILTYLRGWMHGFPAASFEETMNEQRKVNNGDGNLALFLLYLAKRPPQRSSLAERTTPCGKLLPS